MNFFKKLLHLTSSSEEKEIIKHEVNLSLDDSFVHYFIEKGGKFLYCTKLDEVIENFKQIVLENKWTDIVVTDTDLSKLIKKIDIKKHTKHNSSIPFFTTCEHLIADNGNVLFSSNQLSSVKLSELSKDIILYASVSQLVKNTGEGLTGIKTNFKGNIPTNISAIKNYNINKNDDNFLNYGNTNSKNLYLLLFEDL
jgi:L-lactate utilization protein LutC